MTRRILIAAAGIAGVLLLSAPPAGAVVRPNPNCAHINCPPPGGPPGGPSGAAR